MLSFVDFYSGHYPLSSLKAIYTIYDTLYTTYNAKLFLQTNYMTKWSIRLDYKLPIKFAKYTIQNPLIFYKLIS